MNRNRLLLIQERMSRFFQVKKATFRNLRDLRPQLQGVRSLCKNKIQKREVGLVIGKSLGIGSCLLRELR